MPETNGAYEIEARRCAHEAGLRYITDQTPGYYRRSRGEKFYYVDADGKRVRNRDVLARIEALVIPPAWTDVWIAPHDNDHLQATGRDARSRKQYRYHARWRECRDANKYARLTDFAKVLSRIRRRVSRDLRKPGMPREKVLAAVVQLLDRSLIRVGNDEYARDNRSFGLTTMKNRHVRVRGSKIQFRFRGKSGVEHELDLQSPRLAKIVRRCQELPGQELFAYVDDDGNVVDVGSADVNDYLREISGQDITAKDFRTWAGTVLAARALAQVPSFRSAAQAKRHVAAAVKEVAAQLGNTAAVCRKCYIHPEVVESYMEQTLTVSLQQRVTVGRGMHGLRQEEQAVYVFLKQRIRCQRTTRRRKAG